MAASDNKDIVLRQWYRELWDGGNLGVADELFTADYRLHVSGNPAPIGREIVTHVVSAFRAAFPDLTHTVDELIGEGTGVAARWTLQGTHRGEFQGLVATGRSIRLSGTTIHHFADGKIVETWLTLDNLELLQQLGAVPAR